MKKCKECNEYPERHTERIFVEAICEIRCPKCGKTVEASAFWCSDASNRAEREWNKQN